MVKLNEAPGFKCEIGGISLQQRLSGYVEQTMSKRTIIVSSVAKSSAAPYTQNFNGGGSKTWIKWDIMATDGNKYRCDVLEGTEPRVGDEIQGTYKPYQQFHNLNSCQILGNVVIPVKVILYPASQALADALIITPEVAAKWLEATVSKVDMDSRKASLMAWQWHRCAAGVIQKEEIAKYYKESLEAVGL